MPLERQQHRGHRADVAAQGGESGEGKWLV